MFLVSRLFGITRRSLCEHDKYSLIIQEIVGKNNNVGLIKMNRPRAFNSLCDGMMLEIENSIKYFENNEQIKCLVLTGNHRAFAAGADIPEMLNRTYSESYNKNIFHNWSCLHNLRIPIIAAVTGLALGGGCEVAMSCDIIYAAENTRFGQPEIKLGTIPGGGGTQNLVRAVGKYNAMRMVLTGEPITAHVAKDMGLVCEVYPNTEVLGEAIKTAETIAEYSRTALMLCKDAVRAGHEMTLNAGLAYERRLFWSTFALNDRKEGMSAFLEKRKPNFTGS